MILSIHNFFLGFKVDLMISKSVDVRSSLIELLLLSKVPMLMPRYL